MLVFLIIPNVIYVIGGYSKGAAVNTLQKYDMTTQKWTTLQPMKEKRSHHAVCLQRDRRLGATVGLRTTTRVRPSTQSRKGLFYPILVGLPTIV